MIDGLIVIGGLLLFTVGMCVLGVFAIAGGLWPLSLFMFGGALLCLWGLVTMTNYVRSDRGA